MPRVDACCPYHAGVNSVVFKDDESETEAKTNSGPFVSAVRQKSTLRMLSTRLHTHTHTHTHTPSVPDKQIVFFVKKTDTIILNSMFFLWAQLCEVPAPKFEKIKNCFSQGNGHIMPKINSTFFY